MNDFYKNRFVTMRKLKKCQKNLQFFVYTSNILQQIISIKNWTTGILEVVFLTC